MNDVPRTQDMKPIWVGTSAFFMFKKEIFTVHNRRIGFKPYIQEVSGIEAIDIDEKKDYDLACKLVGIEAELSIEMSLDDIVTDNFISYDKIEQLFF